MPHPTLRKIKQMPVNKVARRKPALPVVPDDSFDSLRKLFTSREAGESASLATLQEKTACDVECTRSRKSTALG